MGGTPDRGAGASEAERVEGVRHAVAAALESVAASHTPGAVSWSGVRSAMRAAGEELGGILLSPGGGVDLERLAGHLGVRCEYVFGAAFEATIAPRRGQLVVTLNGRRSHHRQRSSMAHELGHALFWDRRSQRRARILEYPAWDRRATEEEEAACWAFAGALLVPETALAALGLPATEMNAERLVGIARRLAVSADLLAQRVLVDLGWYPRCVYRESVAAGRVRLRSHNGRWIRSSLGTRHPVMGALHRALTQAAGRRAAVGALLQEVGASFSCATVSTPVGDEEIYWLLFPAGLAAEVALEHGSGDRH